MAPTPKKERIDKHWVGRVSISVWGLLPTGFRPENEPFPPSRKLGWERLFFVAIKQLHSQSIHGFSVSVSSSLSSASSNTKYRNPLSLSSLKLNLYALE